MARVELMHGDCLDLMCEIPDGSVDAIVTDPPYGLAFMGKEWDGSTPSEEYWREALRVAKPGAHLLCFGGTRTFHRMTCAIEDAGWEIRDCIMWVYGSGFPKSMDVSKAIDKALGAEREKVPNPLAKQQTASIGTNAYGDYNATTHIAPTPATDEAAQWDGWGTCLKPAWEPIIVARKPLDGTVAHNVMTWGVGALNIDGCRVPTEDVISYGSANIGNGNIYGQCKGGVKSTQHSAGRFPANLVHDGSDEVVALFPDTGKSSGGGGFKPAATGGVYGTYAPKDNPPNVGIGDSGSAARFFYCAKASKTDRGEGNDHPTVKPTDLMRWLVRLVCPKDGTVLDPFCGSGSTGVACAMEGMEFVGIERDEHYCEIARRRIDEAASTPRLAI